ncbi:hypothetical protein CK203_111519 [Vitis vinifera]|uniref:Uncharacterized protein n=1 Tax=Vitis vinifera TaxID=29760 RepID=A0A438EWM9_VITVI|nr:hypothetical protein CK203_111519 [Vitis vinifera]
MNGVFGAFQSWLSTDGKEYQNGDYILLKDDENPNLGVYDKPLPCFGCGIGWFSLLLGFAFPLMWYYATILYFCNYYQKDPRERAGLAASAIAGREWGRKEHLNNLMNCFDMYNCHGDYSSCYDILVDHYNSILVPAICMELLQIKSEQKNPPPPPPSSTATIGHLATHFIQPPAPTSFYFVFPVSYPPAIIPKTRF